MQQNSGIIELKDRLVQALDEQCNVKDLNEVNRVVSILERTSITREDLERTRLGKYINELRKKTNDKELSKRAKKLIKTWRDAVDAAGTIGASNGSAGSTTSPFLSSSTPNNYAPVLTPNGQHPAVARIRSQHLTSPHEKSASPSSSTSPIANGKKVSPLAKHPKMNGKSVSNLTSPVNKPNHDHQHSYHLNGHALSQRLSSPSFKNRLVNNELYANGQRGQRINSVSSSQHASPLAFAFASTANSKQPIVLGEYTSVDTNDDDDSNSSSAFFLSRSGLPDKNDTNTANDDKGPKRGRKKKPESAPDSLRDNLKSLLASTSGRRPQSTSEIVQSLNINLNTDRLNSFSASSSPAIASAKTSPENVSRKRAHFANGTVHTNGFNHSEEDSLNDIKSKRRRLAQVVSTNNASSLPVSPMLIIKKTPSGHYSATSSPAFAKMSDVDDEGSRDSSSFSTFMPKIKIRSPQRPIHDEEDGDHEYDEEESDGEEDEEDEEEDKEIKTVLSTQSMVEKEIDDILAQLPPIEPCDAEAAKDFMIEDDEQDTKDEDVQVQSSLADSWINPKRIELVGEDDKDEDWEEIDYDEEYDEEEDEEIEVTDNDDDEPNNCDDNNDNVTREQQLEPIDEPTLPRDNYNCDTDPGMEESGEQDTKKTDEDEEDDEDDFVEVTEDKKDDNQMKVDSSSDSIEEVTSSSDKVKSEDDDEEIVFMEVDKQPQTEPASVASATDEVKSTMISNEEDEGEEESEKKHEQEKNIYLENPIYILNQHFLVGPESIEEMLEKSRAIPIVETVPIPSMDPADQASCDETPENDKDQPPVEGEAAKPKKTKTMKRRVVRRRKRRVHARVRVKRSLVDRIANEQWENMNGTYDKDGCWREFGEMTSARVGVTFKEGETDEETGVLHILPYVNYTW